MFLCRSRVHRITLSTSFLQGYFIDLIQTLHDDWFGQYAVESERWLTLTYLSRSQRSNFDLFSVVAYFVKVYWIPAKLYMIIAVKMAEIVF